MKKRTFSRFALSAALLLSFALSGCGSQPAPSQAAAPSQATAPSQSGSAAAEPAGETVLRYGRDWEKDFLDPGRFESYRSVCLAPYVFETLFTYDDDLNPKSVLAESWDVSDDKLTYTFHIRKGVQFHQRYGELKASDIKFTIERMKDPAVGSTTPLVGLGVENMAEIAADDDYTLRIVLKEPDFNFIYKMCDWYCYVVSEKAVKDKGLDEFNRNPVGTGPFAFDKGQAGQRTEVVSHKEYWGGQPKIDRVVFIIISEPATMFNALEAGELDICGVSDAGKFVEYQKNPKYSTYIAPTRSYGFLGMNFSIKPFDDLRVRQAVAYAIDYDGMINDFYLGLETAPDNMLSPLSKYAVEHNFQYQYDPAKAKALLAEAGYPDGFDTSMYCINDQISIGPATLCQNYLSQVGIRAELMPLDLGVYASTAKSGKAPLVWSVMGGEVIPDTYMLTFTSAYAPTAEKEGRNIHCWRNDAYDQAMADVMAATTEEARSEAYARAQAVMAQELPFAPTNTSGAFYVMHNYVKGISVSPTQVVRLAEMSMEK